MRRGHKILSIGMLTTLLLLTYPYTQPSIGKKFVNYSHMNDVLENLNKTKKGWWESLNHNQKMNESETEQKWYNWTLKWQEKYNKTSEKFKEKWENHEFKNLTKKHVFIGEFSYENGYSAGDFVKFMFNDTNIIDYTVIKKENITVFNFIKIEGFHPAEQPMVHGAVWRVNGENASIEIHDNPTAMLKIKVLNQPHSITFYPNDGITVNKKNNNSVEVSGEINGTIILAGKGNIELSNTSIKIAVEDNKGCVLFLSEPDKNTSISIHHQWKYEEKIRKQIAKGRVFARVLIDNDNNSDDMVFTNGTINCLTFKNRVKIELNGSGENKTIFVDVSNRVLNLSGLKKLKVTVDGEKAATENYSNILNETGTIPKYATINGSNGVMIIVYLPHFSAHTINIYMEGLHSNTPGFEIVFTVISLLVTVIIKRKKNY